MDSRFVRCVCVVSSHQVARGVLHLAQIVCGVRLVGRGWEHSAQSIVVEKGGELNGVRGRFWEIFGMLSDVG